MNPRTPLRKAEWLGAVVIFLAFGAVLFVVTSDVFVTVQCDGEVPTWMITDENEGTGCVELLPGPPPRDWDGSWICVGMCAGPVQSPYFPSAEP